MRAQESNRLGAPGSSDVRASIEATLSFFDRQIDEIDVQIRSIIDNDPTLRGKRELLTSIPGIGERPPSRFSVSCRISASFGALRHWLHSPGFARVSFARESRYRRRGCQRLGTFICGG
jgi:hypothetical protein